MVKLEHWIDWSPAYGSETGIGSAVMTWYVRGEAGVVQFQTLTGWYLPQTVRKESPMPSDLGYHSLYPQYDGQKSFLKECPLLSGRPCYYDGSTLNAQRPFDLLLAAGGDAVWNYLDEYYTKLFGGS